MSLLFCLHVYFQMLYWYELLVLYIVSLLVHTLGVDPCKYSQTTIKNRVYGSKFEINFSFSLDVLQHAVFVGLTKLVHVLRND